MIPYLRQDGYNRKRSLKDFKAVVLENDYLKAVFIPELGRRMWQLYDKEKQQDLVYVNPVFQPCNLALRNAWFSGGVEFNIGMQGHTPFTCSPLFYKSDKTKTDYSIKAHEMLPEHHNLAIDCANILSDIGQYERLLQMIEELSEELQALGRIQLAKANALIALDRLEEASEIINTNFVLPDVQEGECSVSSAWLSLHERLLMREGLSETKAKEQVENRYPIPYELDFRMG